MVAPRARGGVAFEEAISLGSHPKGSVGILDDAGYFLLNGGDTSEGLGATVEEAETSPCADPQPTLPIFVQRRDFIILETLRIPRIVSEDDECVSVIAVQTLFGTKPEEAYVILEDGLYCALRQALLD